MSFWQKQVLRFRSFPFAYQITVMMFPITIAVQVLIQLYSIHISRLPANYTLLQIGWLSFFSLLIICLFELVFYCGYSKKLSNSFIYWQSKELSTKERTDILEATGAYPIKKAIFLALMFITIGCIYSACSHIIMKADLFACIFFFHIYVSIAYIYILIAIYVMEKKCSMYAIKIAAQGIDLKEKKFFGLSQRSNFIIYLVVPVIGTAFITIHGIFYAFHAQSILGSNINNLSGTLKYLESMGIYVKTNLTKPEILFFVIKISAANAIASCLMILFYYVRILSNNSLIQNSLLLLNNRNINQKNLFEVNIFSEDSYTMYLINRTFLLFDSIIRNNTRANKNIEEISGLLSDISAKTTENVLTQSSNIEEILATMQSIDNLSNKIENSFDEVITVASKTMNSVDTTFYDLKSNLDKIKEITDTNLVTIDNLKTLSEKISGIGDVVNFIDKLAEQTKTVAFNSELEANNINAKGVNFTNVSGDIRNLSNSILEITKKIHNKLSEITSASQKIITTGNYCMKKIEEGNQICLTLAKNFEEIKQSSKSTSINSSSIKETLHQQTNSFHQIIETLSQIAKSVRNFGEASSSIADTIEKLRQSSLQILAINNKYNKTDSTQEGNAI